MLRLFIRFIGLLLLAGGFVALVVDGTRSLAGGTLLVTTLARGARQFFPAGFLELQRSVEHVSAFLWDPIVATLLLTPVSVAFCGMGALLILLSQRRRESFGYYAR